MRVKRAHSAGESPPTPPSPAKGRRNCTGSPRPWLPRPAWLPGKSLLSRENRSLQDLLTSDGVQAAPGAGQPCQVQLVAAEVSSQAGPNSISYTEAQASRSLTPTGQLVSGF